MERRRKLERHGSAARHQKHFARKVYLCLQLKNYMYEASNMKPAKAASSDETWELYQKNIFNNDNLHFFIILREQQKDSSSSIVIRKMKLIRFHIFFFRSKVSEEAIFCRFRLPSTQVGNLLREQHFLVWLNWNCNSISCEKLVAASLPLRNSQFSIIVSYLVADTL